MPVPLRTEIRDEIANVIENYTGSIYFADNYPTVNIKDFDIAGQDLPEYFPIVNIISTRDLYNESPISKSDRTMEVIIDVIPWCDDENCFDESDKVLDEFPDVIYANPQWNKKAIDTEIVSGEKFRLGLEVPAMKVRFTLNLKYRRPRPL